MALETSLLVCVAPYTMGVPIVMRQSYKITPSGHGYTHKLNIRILTRFLRVWPQPVAIMLPCMHKQLTILTQSLFSSIMVLQIFTHIYVYVHSCAHKPACNNLLLLLNPQVIFIVLLI